MFPPVLYAHPRPSGTHEYEYPVFRGSRNSKKIYVSDQRGDHVRNSLALEGRLGVGKTSCIVDGRGNFSVSCSDRIFVTEDVGEALRYKQRMQARAAFRSSLRTSGLRGPVESFNSTPSSSCASSPASSPPTTPIDSVPGVDFPTVVAVRTEPRPRSPSASAAPVAERTGRWLSTSRHAERSSPRSNHRPSRSRPPVVHQRISQSSPCQSLVSSAPAALETSSTSASSLLDLVKRLAPLPPFNPFRRARAVSMSSIVDDVKIPSPNLNLRRRSKSESACPPRRR